MPVIGPKMQENTSKLKNVDLQNKSYHVILRNLYAASFLVWPACVLMSMYTTWTDLSGDRMSSHAGTRAQEMNHPSSLVPSDGSLALTPRCPN